MTPTEALDTLRKALEAKTLVSTTAGGVGNLPGTVPDPAYGPLLALFRRHAGWPMPRNFYITDTHWLTEPDGALDGAICFAIPRNEPVFAEYMAEKLKRTRSGPLTNDQAIEALLEALGEKD